MFHCLNRMFGKKGPKRRGRITMVPAPVNKWAKMKEKFYKTQRGRYIYDFSFWCDKCKHEETHELLDPCDRCTDHAVDRGLFPSTNDCQWLAYWMGIFEPNPVCFEPDLPEEDE